MLDIENEKYLNFFEELNKFKEKQQKQKERGLNDYNLLTTVLNEHDEVRLHSRVIFSLLNINGLHYQGDLFLEKFIEVLDLELFGFDTKSSNIYLEYKNIDLYLTDGNKHIIIENKIYAEDQKNQIQRYINIIKGENQEIDYDEILVIYLSIDRTSPSSYSLRDLKIDENRILDKDIPIALFKNINYKTEILYWLEKSQYEIQNITNLNESIEQYTTVVKKISKKYKEKVMSIETILLKNKEFYAISNEIEKSLPKIKDNTINNFFTQSIQELKQTLGEEWIIEITGNLKSKYGFPFRVYKKSWKEKSNKYLLIGFEFEATNYKNGFLGVVRKSDKVKIDEVIKEFESEIEKIDKDFQKEHFYKSGSWWMYGKRDYPIKGDFITKVLFEDITVNDFNKSVLLYIDELENKTGLLTSINNYLSNK